MPRVRDDELMKAILELERAGYETAKIAETLKKNPETIRRYRRTDDYAKMRSKASNRPVAAFSPAKWAGTASDRERASNSLFWFSHDFLGYKDLNEPTHGELCRILDEFESHNKNLLILMPRGTYKTTLVIFCYMVRELLKDPSKSYALQFASYKKGTDWMADIQAKFEDPKVQAVWGDYVNPQCWRADKLILKGAPKSREGNVMIFGADQGMAGYHPKRIIFDDLHDEKNSTSPEQIAKIVKTFSRSITEIATDDTKCIMVATIWDKHDSAAKVIGDIEGLDNWDELIAKKYHKGKIWDIYIRQSIENDEGGEPMSIEAVDPRSGKVTKTFRTWDKAKLFFPEKLSLESLKKKYTQSPSDYDFACQYFNTPTLLENIEFTADMLANAKIPKDEQIVGRVYLLVDPAYTVNKKSDSTAYVVCGFNKNNELIVKFAHKEQMDSKAVVDTVFSLQQQWKPGVVAIEANATQIVLSSWIKDKRKEKGQFFKITPVKTTTKKSKADIIRKLIPYFKEGRIYIPEQFEELYDELAMFPRGSHDDLINALAFIEVVRKPVVQQSMKDWRPENEFFGFAGYTPAWEKRG